MSATDAHGMSPESNDELYWYTNSNGSVVRFTSLQQKRQILGRRQYAEPDDARLDKSTIPGSFTVGASGYGETFRQDSILDEMRDWSETGRGQHIEFEVHESVPLIPGRMLGRGAMGDVFETTIRGHSIAWKRIMAKRKVISHQRKEVEILKKLSHAHMVQLVGTYTHQLSLGILLYPVAVCDLCTFFEDVEAHWTTGADEEQKSRLTTFNYLPLPGSSSRASPAYCQIGCLVSAIEYLHNQEIRHKDLKPSNILLSPNRLWLSDFGSATDFSLLSQSATDNERGTPRYFAPEVADWQKNGRAADMFSLGCVLLEIIVLHAHGTLKRIRDNRPNPNPAFHANLRSLDKWLPFSDACSPRDHHLVKEVRGMLSKDPSLRPTAQDLLRRLSLADEMMEPEGSSVFGDCCRLKYVSPEMHREQLRIGEEKIKSLRAETAILNDELRVTKQQRGELIDRLADASGWYQKSGTMKAPSILSTRPFTTADVIMGSDWRPAPATLQGGISPPTNRDRFVSLASQGGRRSGSPMGGSPISQSQRVNVAVDHRATPGDDSTNDSDEAVIGYPAVVRQELRKMHRRKASRASTRPDQPKPGGFFAWAAGGNSS